MTQTTQPAFIPTAEAARRLRCHPATLAQRMTRLGLMLRIDPADHRFRLVAREDFEVLLERYAAAKEAGNA